MAAPAASECRAKDISDRDGGIGRSAWRQPDEGVAPAPRRRRAVRRRRRPVDGARRTGVAVSDRRTVDHGIFGGSEAVAEAFAAYPGDRRCGDAGHAGHSRDHRQSRLHPSGGKTGPGPRSLAADHRLRIPYGLGVAAGPGARDAGLRRSRPRSAAFRTGGISPASRSALQLCRSSPDRTNRRASSRCRRTTAPGRPTAGSAGAAGKPPRRDQPSHGGIRRNAGPAGPAVRSCPSHLAAFAGCGSGGREKLAGRSRGSSSANRKRKRHSASRARLSSSQAR